MSWESTIIAALRPDDQSREGGVPVVAQEDHGLWDAEDVPACRQKLRRRANQAGILVAGQDKGDGTAVVAVRLASANLPDSERVVLRRDRVVGRELLRLPYPGPLLSHCPVPHLALAVAPLQT